MSEKKGVKEKFNEETHDKMEIYCQFLEIGLGKEESRREISLDNETVKRYLIAFPEFAHRIKKARFACLTKISKDIIHSKHEHAKMTYLSRVWPKFFGKKREEALDVNLTEETLAILQDDSASYEAKLKAVAQDFYAKKISLELYERLVSLLRTTYNHDEKENENSTEILAAFAKLIPSNDR